MIAAELRVIVRPRATYEALAATLPAPTLWVAARRPLLLLLVIGCFISLTTAERLVAFHVATTMLSWSFGPLAQALALAVALRLVARQVRLAHALDLLMVGASPWVLLLLATSGVFLFAPDLLATFRALLSAGVLQAAVLLALVWSVALTWACLRHGLALAPGRATAALCVYYTLYLGVFVAWLLGTHQLAPLLVSA